MRMKMLSLSLASVIALVACGEKAETSETTQVDAERPYAEPTTAPSHADAATAPVRDDNTDNGRAALEEAAGAVSASQGKVDNVVSSTGDAMKDSMKNIALAAEEEDASEGSDDDPFGFLAGDPVRGKRLFAQCQACHSTVEGQNRAGPPLYKIVGRKAGEIEGYFYSEAIKTSNVTWTEDALFAYLDDPQEYLPGTRMFFPGVAKPQDRVDIIVYLNSLTD